MKSKCEACQLGGGGLCPSCQAICNDIAIEKMINGEPMPPDNTLRDTFTTFLQDNAPRNDKEND
jgi:hypothetical protein